MRVAWFPKAADLVGNPYWELLQGELSSLGVEFEVAHSSYWISRSWLLARRGRVRVLHFHFIQPHYVGQGNRASLKRLTRFASDLLFAKVLGYRIVWTMHDLFPTWPLEPHWVERLARYTIAWLADDIIVHCECARRLAGTHFRRTHQIWTLPLPSYRDVHPNTVDRNAARARLGLPAGTFVFGFIGGIRPNKGIEDLLSAFIQIQDPRARLVIAGRPWPPDEYVQDLLAQAHEDPRIVIRAELIPDDEMQLHINSADVLVFPFQQILTSSSVMLAMSFGRPVIVPRMGCLPELVGDDAGFLYSPGDLADLATNMQRAMGTDLLGMGLSAAQRATSYNWKDLARMTKSLYDRSGNPCA